MRFGMVGAQLDGATEASDCFVYPPRMGKQIAEREMRHGVVGLEHDGMAEGGCGHVSLTKAEKRGREIIMRLRLIGPNRDRAAIGGCGLLTAVEVAQDIAKIVIAVGIIRLQRHGPAETIHRLGLLAEAGMGDAQQVQQDDRVRVALGQRRGPLDKLAVKSALLQREKGVDFLLGHRPLPPHAGGRERGEACLRATVVRKAIEYRSIQCFGFGDLALPGKRLRALDRLFDAYLHALLPRDGWLVQDARYHGCTASGWTVKSTMISPDMRSSASRS
jgi:hypothetical protein